MSLKVSVCVCQENIWLDSVSLLIKDTFDGEMLLIDKLSGSVFHHYSSPSSCKDCRSHPEEVQTPTPYTLSHTALQLQINNSNNAQYTLQFHVSHTADPHDRAGASVSEIRARLRQILLSGAPWWPRPRRAECLSGEFLYSDKTSFVEPYRNNTFRRFLLFPFNVIHSILYKEY